ncbi:hypothetical protein BS78_01G420000 [Paspalum vaginatum]|nr:hypothetical protein BS78_01G420000 [Paspalum vaginatum]
MPCTSAFRGFLDAAIGRHVAGIARSSCVTRFASVPRTRKFHWIGLTRAASHLQGPGSAAPPPGALDWPPPLFLSLPPPSLTLLPIHHPVASLLRLLRLGPCCSLRAGTMGTGARSTACRIEGTSYMPTSTTAAMPRCVLWLQMSQLVALDAAGKDGDCGRPPYAARPLDLCMSLEHC